MQPAQDHLVYQFLHPWHWLTYSQNATSAGIVIALFVNLLTVYVLMRTLAAVNSQAIAADRQAKAAEAQVESAAAATRVSELQLEAARESAAAEREHSDLLRRQYLAFMRPVLVFAQHNDGHGMSLTLTNESKALAFDVEVYNGTQQAMGTVAQLGQQLLGADGATWIRGIDRGPYQMNAGRFVGYDRTAPVFARYRSQDGRWFVTRVADVNVNESYKNIFDEE